MERSLPWPWAMGLAIVLAIPAGARVEATSEARLRTVCLDRGAARHPKKEALAVLVPDDRFAGAGGATVVLLYQPELSNSGARGRVAATVTRIAADGSRTEIARLAGRQSDAALPLQLVDVAETALERGDLVAFDVTLKGFDKLRGDECFTLIALVTPLE